MLKVAILDDYQNVSQEFVDLKKLSGKYEIKVFSNAFNNEEEALEQLSSKKIIDLDEDKKATMVSNLLVVLCSETDTTPVVNTGTIY